jgi:hypothetical protein
MRIYKKRPSRQSVVQEAITDQLAANQEITLETPTPEGFLKSNVL